MYYYFSQLLNNFPHFIHLYFLFLYPGQIIFANHKTFKINHIISHIILYHIILYITNNTPHAKYHITSHSSYIFHYMTYNICHSLNIIIQISYIIYHYILCAKFYITYHSSYSVNHKSYNMNYITYIINH